MASAASAAAHSSHNVQSAGFESCDSCQSTGQEAHSGRQCHTSLSAPKSRRRYSGIGATAPRRADSHNAKDTTGRRQSPSDENRWIFRMGRCVTFLFLVRSGHHSGGPEREAAMRCGHCGGTGKCPACKGKGVVRPKRRAGTPATGKTPGEICIKCGATGRCQVCNGLGSPVQQPNA